MRGAAVMKNNLNKARTIMDRPSSINGTFGLVCVIIGQVNHIKRRGYKPKLIEHMIVEGWEGPFTLAALSPLLNIRIIW